MLSWSDAALKGIIRIEITAFSFCNCGFFCGEFHPAVRGSQPVHADSSDRNRNHHHLGEKQALLRRQTNAPKGGERKVGGGWKRGSSDTSCRSSCCGQKWSCHRERACKARLQAERHHRCVCRGRGSLHCSSAYRWRSKHRAHPVPGRGSGPQEEPDITQQGLQIQRQTHQSGLLAQSGGGAKEASRGRWLTKG